MNFYVVSKSGRRTDALNIRQLFGPLFFERNVRHPDMKRQRSRRQLSKDRKVARALKRVPMEAPHLPLVALEAYFPPYRELFSAEKTELRETLVKMFGTSKECTHANKQI